MKQDHRVGPKLASFAADHGINAVLAAAGHNFGRILAWLRILLAWILYTPGASKMVQAA
jgi:hypothetical protein